MTHLDRADYLTSCEGKVKRGAVEAKWLAKKQSMDAYRCRHGSHWHVGHTSIKSARRTPKQREQGNE